MLFILPEVLLDIPRNPIFAVGIPIVLGTLSGVPMRKQVKGEWYKNLVVPPGRLPRLVFPFVWTGLYASMGFASSLAVLCYDDGDVPSLRSAAYHGLKLYWCQLALSVVRMPLFLVFKQPGLATANSALLTVLSSYMTIVLDKPTNHGSTYFLAPCCAWLAYTTYLSGGIWWLNRGRQVGDEKQ
ncbi:TspO/MBR-related protein [Gautieria morchelliformis]|nr:TspO/MBR-related protein [Gautieria morchelliformis]